MGASIRSFNIPLYLREAHVHLTVVHTWGIWTLPGWCGEFKPEVLSLVREYKCYIFKHEDVRQIAYFSERMAKKKRVYTEGGGFKV